MSENNNTVDSSDKLRSFREAQEEYDQFYRTYKNAIDTAVQGLREKFVNRHTQAVTIDNITHLLQLLEKHQWQLREEMTLINARISMLQLSMAANNEEIKSLCVEGESHWDDANVYLTTDL